MLESRHLTPSVLRVVGRVLHVKHTLQVNDDLMSTVLRNWSGTLKAALHESASLACEVGAAGAKRGHESSMPKRNSWVSRFIQCRAIGNGAWKHFHIS